jgi:hypothetical protein
MIKIRNAYKISVTKPEGKMQIERWGKLKLNRPGYDLMKATTNTRIS